MKAFITELYGIKGVVFAKKSGQARYTHFRSAKSAGFKPSLIEITVKRAKEYDYLFEVLGTSKCFSLDYVNNIKI